MRVLLAASLAATVAAGSTAHAFCGFFVAGNDSKLTNTASQVVLLRNGNRTVMTLSNHYQGPTENFAMVVPVPVVLHKEDVKTLPADVFDHIDSLSAPRLVEYWEQDPCFVPPPPSSFPVTAAAPGAGRVRRSEDKDLGVKIEAQFVSGEYQIVILSARDSSGLETWLHQEKYTIPQGAAAALAPYVRDQMKFFVAKVDIKKVKRDAQGQVVLSPLRFGFDANELRLPVRLGLLNANGKQDLLVYILHPTARYEVANYPNVFVPTNLEVADEVRGSFAAFYAQLFDETIAKMNNKAVVTEYAWQTTSCDPCPCPPLQPNDLATLGGDSLPGANQNQGRFGGGFSGWVLTRLHTRYSRDTLSEDLLFREAKPVVGGRANWDGTSLDAGAQNASVNNFQGRYIIRHYWSGKVACDHPQYGRWGGPPNGNQPQPQAAKDLALAPRGKVTLRGVVRSPVPSLGIPGSPPPRRK
jgi:hypothetical protein